MHITIRGSLLLFASAVAAAAESLPPLEILGSRLADNSPRGEIVEWSGELLQQSSPFTIDELLAREPSFSLYRRQSSWFGNPTSSGVSLRNTGATATSRTLVVLDGVPQNDPFGAWVSWARYDTAALDSLRILSPSRSGAWGNQSPAGTIQLTSRSPWQNGHQLRSQAGSYGTIGASTWNQWVDPKNNISLHASAYGFHTDGFYAIPSRQRGPVDEALETNFAGLSIGGAWEAAPHLTVQPRLSYHWEDRGNGTDIAQNATEALDLSLRITSEEVDSSWQWIAYHQIRTFGATFPSVGPGRATETIALEQYEVPSTGTGAAWNMNREFSESFSLSSGVDIRFLDGETRENAGTFRNRIAGGKQSHQGIFLTPSWRPRESTTLSSTLRLDAWQLTDGRRTERLLSTGTLARDDQFADRNDWEPSATLDGEHHLRDHLTIFASAGSSFRLPTLNELHRPFRVRNDVVEANPLLAPERFFSISAGADWQVNDQFSIRLDAFHHWIDDAIANVPITDPAEAARIFGPIPVGGSVSQRRNVDLATVAGLEWSARWTPREQLSLSVSQLWTDTQFRSSSDQPLLEGMPFPQAPEWRTTALVEWSPIDALSVFLGADHSSPQFDDALASRELAAFTNIRTGIRWKSGPVTYRADIENLLDAEIQAGLASNGLITTAAPRMLRLSVDWEF